ncbi:hypothetical protein GF312_00190 [Candidatus Poribacteria bacterium]|nr:hypothetical protein [Candidatus Poribacteria bacterium]
MALNCHEMKKGTVYVCEGCGLKLEVIEECKECGTSAAECECHEEEGNECTFSCCGKDLVKQK